MKAKALLLALAATLLTGCGGTPEGGGSQGGGESGGGEVQTVTLTSIAVTTNPTKTEYLDGDSFDPAGMVVTATYSDGSSKVVTNYQLPNQALKAGDTSVTITLDGKTASVAITVSQKYNITFKMDDGSVYKVVPTKAGEVPSVVNPTKRATQQYTYTFAGWASTMGGEVLTTLPAAAGDVTYYAVFDKTVNKYTVTLDSNCEKLDTEITADYGTSFADFEDYVPEREGYHFAGWCYDEGCTQKVTFPYTLTADDVLYAKWNEKIDIKSYLKSLLAIKDYNPYSFIPETLRPTYEDNFVNKSYELDYSTKQSVSSIKTVGFGEQWQMIIDNMNQSEKFYTVLSGTDSIFSAAIGAFMSYFESNPEATEGNVSDKTYTAHCSYEDGVISVSISFLKDISIPVIGSLKPSVAMQYAVKTGEKYMTISLNDDNKIKCKFTEDSYVFGISYGLTIAGKTGLRTAYCQLDKDEESYEGHIYEYFSYINDESEKTLLKSSADFYIDEDYCSVIGNKASGIVGSGAVINELYDVEEGHLLAYEVVEDIKTVTYHTFWFNLEDISAIGNVKLVGNGKIDPTDNHHDVYVNDSAKIFEPAYNKTFGIKTSRRYDIEMRDHYYYFENDEGKVERKDAQLPMMFIQDDDKYYTTKYSNTAFSDFSNDMAETSKITGAAVTVSSSIVSKVRNDCINLGPIYSANKEAVTPEAIIEWLK